jgi:hypothetical protein
MWLRSLAEHWRKTRDNSSLQNHIPTSRGNMPDKIGKVARKPKGLQEENKRDGLRFINYVIESV